MPATDKAAVGVEYDTVLIQAVAAGVNIERYAEGMIAEPGANSIGIEKWWLRPDLNRGPHH